jgi:serine O-acetyltransferase
VFELVSADLRRKAEWYGHRPSLKAMLRMVLSDGSTAQLLYRAMRFCQTHHLQPFAVLLYRLNAAVGHTVIGRGADIGPGFVILHSFSIVVNTSVRAGRNLVVGHKVTIGADNGESPVLGDNVFIGAGAKVLGGIRVGSNVKIGANSLVVRDLPDGATAVGVPARIVDIAGDHWIESNGAQRASAANGHARAA